MGPLVAALVVFGAACGDSVENPGTDAEVDAGHLDATLDAMSAADASPDGAGDAAASCEVGLQDNDGNGTCTADCAPTTCGMTGMCDAASGTATCTCLAGYAGADCGDCDAGYQDEDEDGVCHPACAAETCSGHGTCTIEVGMTTCACAGGYTGADCSACPEGTQDRDDNGTCMPACTDGTCSGHGSCDDASGTATCTCDPGFAGPDCERTCTRTERVPVTCTGADSIVCATLMDGNEANTVDAYCSESPTPSYCGFEGMCAAEGCIEDLVLLFDLGEGQMFDRVRFNADWWNKRPDAFEVWVSDDPGQGPGTGATLVYAGHAHAAPWRCVTGASCADESVPDACCPDGRAAPQDMRNVGLFRTRYDFADFAPVTARYVHFVVRDVYVKSTLVLMEIDVFGTVCTEP